MTDVLIDRELLERAERNLASGDEAYRTQQELRAALAAPVQGEAVELWAVHAQGSDDIYPAFSKEDAEKHASELNALPMPEGIAVGAVVVHSPWPAAEHWEYLAEEERDHKEQIMALAAPQPSAGVVMPEGYALVPQRMYLSEEAIESITVHCGDGQDDAGYGPYQGGVLWIGEIEEEDGTKTYGLHIATADYPEAGSTTLYEFARLNGKEVGNE